MVQSLVDAGNLKDSSNAQKLLRILDLPHFHHHEKQSVVKPVSSIKTSGINLHQTPMIIINDDADQTGSRDLQADDLTRSEMLINHSRDPTEMTVAEREETRSLSQSTTKVNRIFLSFLHHRF